MAGGRLPITRNRTSDFIKYRTDRRKAVTNPGYEAIPAGESLSNLLLGGPDLEGGPATVARGPVLQPRWCDDADEAQDYLKDGWQKLAALQKAQKKRLLNVFQDDAAPDRDVEALSRDVANLIRSCDKCIHQVKTRPSDHLKGESSGPQDQEHRVNVQRKLAAELRELSKQCRQAQRDYLDEIKRRQKGAQASGSSAAAEQAGASGAVDSALDGMGQQTVGGLTTNVDLDRAEDFAAQRSAEVAQIAQSFSELHQIFQELAVLVIDQGTVLDRIDFNMEQMVQSTMKANTMVEKTAQKKKADDKRAFWAMLVMVGVNMLLLLILMLKYKNKFGWSFEGMFTFLGVTIAVCVGSYYLVRHKPEWIHKICPTCASCFLPSSTNPNAPTDSRWTRWTSSAKSAVGLGDSRAGIVGGGGAGAAAQAASVANRVAGPKAAMQVAQAAAGFR